MDCGDRSIIHKHGCTVYEANLKFDLIDIDQKCTQCRNLHNSIFWGCFCWHWHHNRWWNIWPRIHSLALIELLGELPEAKSSNFPWSFIYLNTHLISLFAWTYASKLQITRSYNGNDKSRWNLFIHTDFCNPTNNCIIL